MQFKTILKCQIPRSDCPEHGVKTVLVPWSHPSSRFTFLFEEFAIEVLICTKNIADAGRLLGLSWKQLHQIQKRAVERGMENRDLGNVPYLGIDEKNFRKGHSYVSVLNDLSEGRVIDVVEDRTLESANKLMDSIPEVQRFTVQAIAMDMWDAFITSAKENIPWADIVHDKFHVSSYLGKGVDKVRRSEQKQSLQAGNTILTGTKYLWLSNPQNWNEKQKELYNELKHINLKVGKAFAIKEMFREFWNYTYTESAAKYFKRWYFLATHSKLKPIISAAKTIKRHINEIMTYFKHRITNSASESINSKIQMIKASARGFRNFNNYRIAILFYCGKLNFFPQTMA